MLHITGRRDDGYHLLQTVFQFIDLNDRLTFDVTDDGLITRVQANTSVPESSDIIMRAAKLLQARYQPKFGVRISIDKQIPIGAGLGGGSSNAATTLLALNRLWGLNLRLAELSCLGLELGADVPVFIAGRSAWASGIGEQLTPIELPEPWYLVIHPGIFVSTAEIFSAEQLTRNCDAITIRAFLEGSARNVCEPVVCQRYPEVRQALDWLGQLADGAKMTGTGASVFAAFNSLNEAERVKSSIPEQWSGFVAKAMNTNPVSVQCGILETGN